MTIRPTDSWNTCLNTTLEQEDKEIYDIVENEKLRQWSGLELIASEVCIMGIKRKLGLFQVTETRKKKCLLTFVCIHFRTSPLKLSSRLMVPL